MNTFWKAIVLGCVAFSAVLAESLCGAATATFSNANLVVLNDTGPFGFARATPYPATINVSGFSPSAIIQKVTLTLHNLRHATPDDLDFMLVGPTEQNIVVFADCGGGFANEEVPITITLDDDAAEGIPEYGPDTGSLASGTYRPTNFGGGGNVFPPSAPAPSTARSLAVFAGTNPNGNWQLYIVDDNALDSGSISNGWSLTIRTVVPAPQLKIARSGAHAILHWPTNDTGFTLQSTTNLVSPIIWTSNTPAPVIVDGENTVTNVVSGTKKFYRLLQ